METTEFRKLGDPTGLFGLYLAYSFRIPARQDGIKRYRCTLRMTLPACSSGVARVKSPVDLAGGAELLVVFEDSFSEIARF